MDANAALTVTGLAAASIASGGSARFANVQLQRNNVTYSSANGYFTVPVTDWYTVRAQVFGSFTGNPRMILSNATDVVDIASGITATTATGPETGATLDCTVQLTAGKSYYIKIFGGPYTYYTGDTFNMLQVQRVAQYSASQPVGFGKSNSNEFGLVAPRRGQYSLSTTCSLAGWSAIRAVGIYYQDQDGNHRLKFNINGTFTSTTHTSSIVTIAGVTFKNGIVQAVAGYTGGASPGAVIQAYANSNDGTIRLLTASGTGVASLFASGDVELESKPSWA
jgi:hypothetical protein